MSYTESTIVNDSWLEHPAGVQKAIHVHCNRFNSVARDLHFFLYHKLVTQQTLYLSQFWKENALHRKLNVLL